MKFSRKIVRIGGQSKCEALSSFSLREWRQRATLLGKRPGQYRHWLFEARTKLNETKALVLSLVSIIFTSHYVKLFLFRTLEKHRKTQRIIESYGILHSVTLLSLGILPDNVYSKLRILKMNNLCAWLQMESIQILRSIVSALRKYAPKPQEPPAKAAVETGGDEDESRNEEEWDKEDVEEIEGNNWKQQLISVSLL